MCHTYNNHYLSFIIRRNSRDDQPVDDDIYDKRGSYSKEPHGSSFGRPRLTSRGTLPHSSDEERDTRDRRSGSVSGNSRRDNSLERNNNYRGNSQREVVPREVDDSRLYDLEQENSPDKETNVRMISRSRPSMSGRPSNGGAVRPNGAFIPKDVRSSGAGRTLPRNDDDYDDRRRDRGDSYDNNSYGNVGSNYDDYHSNGGNNGRYRGNQDEYHRRDDSYNRDRERDKERDVRGSRDNSRDARSNFRREQEYADERDMRPQYQQSRQSYDPPQRGGGRGRDVGRDYDEEILDDNRRQSNVRSSRDRPPRPYHGDDAPDMEMSRDDRRLYMEGDYDSRDRDRVRQNGSGRGNRGGDEFSYPDVYPPRKEEVQPPSRNQSLRAAHGSWTAHADAATDSDRQRKETVGSDFEVVSDHDDNQDCGLDDDSIEEIPTENASSSNQRGVKSSSNRNDTRGNTVRRQEDDEYHAPAGSFGHYISKQEEQGITLPRKSGRYDDAPEDRENGSGRANGTNSNMNGSGSWVTGGPPVKITTPPPSVAHLSPATFSHTSRNSFVLVAHPRGMRTQHVQCTIVRDRTSMHGKLYPTYELILEEPRKTLIIAQKMSMNRTSNYHLFDMTRGQAGSKLSKKSGNYLGKLRAKNVNRTGYALLNHKSDREEVAGVLFDRITMMDQLKEGNQPRRMTVLVPPLDDEGLSVPVPLHSLGVESLTDLLQAIEENKRVIPDHFSLMHTKDPVFENGNYRLNFHGRVSMPSVKNFQMVSDDDIEDIKCQFGKVDKDIFHLDYKAPFNAVQAFSLALCQFNL